MQEPPFEVPLQISILMECYIQILCLTVNSNRTLKIYDIADQWYPLQSLRYNSP